MSKLHFIKAPCHQSSRDQGFQFAPDEIKQKYDFSIDPNLFSDSVIDLQEDNISLCQGYNLLYKYILEYCKKNPDDKIITIGGDHSISTGTISAMNEKYMKQMGNKCESDLVVLWIDSNTDIFDFNTSEKKDLNEMSVASLLGLCGTYFTKNKLILKPKQIIYYGLVNDADNFDLIKDYKMTFFTVNKINSLDSKVVIKAIKDIIGDRPLHISLDMKALDVSISPSVIPTNKKGLTLDKIENILYALKKNIVSMDIVEYNPCIGSGTDTKLTRETIKYILKNTFDIKEKKINIFTEDSHFLIFRPLEQDDEDIDMGWYILRGLNVEQKEKLIKMIPDGKIISFDIKGEEDIKDGKYLITKTTISEQNEKSYATSFTINEAVLFPQEKICMGFELIN